jgi:hypothetical protein
MLRPGGRVAWYILQKGVAALYVGVPVARLSPYRTNRFDRFGALKPIRTIGL